MTHSQENTVKRGTGGASRVKVTHTNRGEGKKTRQEQCQGDKMTNGTQRKGQMWKKQVYNNTRVSGGQEDTHKEWTGTEDKTIRVLKRQEDKKTRVERDRKREYTSVKGIRGHKYKSGEEMDAIAQERYEKDQRTQRQEEEREEEKEGEITKGCKRHTKKGERERSRDYKRVPETQKQRGEGEC